MHRPEPAAPDTPILALTRASCRTRQPLSARRLYPRIASPVFNYAGHPQVPLLVLKHRNSLDRRPSHPAAVRECDSRCDPRPLLQVLSSNHSSLSQATSEAPSSASPNSECGPAFPEIATSTAQLRGALLFSGAWHPSSTAQHSWLLAFAAFAFCSRRTRKTCGISSFCETLQCLPADSARPELPVRHFRHPPFQGLPHVRDWPGSRLGIFAVRFQPDSPKGRQKSPKAWTSGSPLIAQPPNVSGDRHSGPPTTKPTTTAPGPRTCTGCTPPSRHAPLTPLSAWADRSASWPLHVTPSPRRNKPLRHASSASTAHPLGLPAPPAEDAHPGDPRCNSCCLFSLSACSAERRFRGLCT